MQFGMHDLWPFLSCVGG